MNRKSAPASPVVSIESFGPDEAAEALANLYPGQRKPSRKFVDAYATDMTEGKWQLSNDAITFDDRGHLTNGQHRLQAVVQSDTTQQFLVLRNLPTKAYDALDTGKKRRLADAFRSAGYDHPAELAAAVTDFHYLTVNGRFRQGLAKPLTVPQAMEILESNLQIRDAVENLIPVARRFKFPIGVMAALGASFQSFSEEATAEQFWADLDDGPADISGPVAMLRGKLIDRMATPINRRLSSEVYAAYIVKAWNAYVRGETLQRLRFGRDERFPEIVNG